MTRPVALNNASSQVTQVRTIGGVIVADSATLTDANFDPTTALDCSGFQSIFVGVEIAAGTNPTATIEALVRDADAADGSRWKRIALTPATPAAQTTGALASGQFMELRVDGRLVFLRVTAVTNATSTTSLNILAFPGVPRNPPNRYN